MGKRVQDTGIGSFHWYLNASSEEFESAVKHLQSVATDYLTGYYNVSQKPRTSYLKYKHMDPELAENLKIALSYFYTIDRTVRRRLLKTNLSSLKKQYRIFTYFANVLEGVRTRTHAKDWDDSYNISNRVKMYRHEIAQERTSQQASRETIAGWKPTSFALEPKREGKRESTGYSSVDKALLSIAKLHKAATDCALNGEEQYFIEQVYKTYVPEIIAGAKATRAASEDVTEKAEAQLSQQCSVLITRLNAIISEASQRALDGIATQTEFLNEKFALQSAPTTLSLTK